MIFIDNAQHIEMKLAASVVDAKKTKKYIQEKVQMQNIKTCKFSQIKVEKQSL